jgi:hypothetical protein
VTEDDEDDVIAMLVEPVTEGFCVDVAVMVTYPEPGAVPGAVKAPPEEMLPELADQLTPEL